MPVDPDPDRSYTIRRLYRLGMGAEAAAEAVDADRVTLSLLDHLLGGPRVLSRADAAARAGIPEAVAAGIERATGVGEGVRYNESEVRHLALLGRLLHLLPAEVLLDQLRADMPILRTMALRTLDTADEVFWRTAREEYPDPVDLAVRLAEVAKPLLDVSTELVGQGYRRVVLHLLTSDLIAQVLQGEEQTVEVAVGFVDVVGYTSLSARIDPTGLGDVLTAFEHACLGMVEARPAVQLVKFMGDAAMFVALDVVELAEGLFDLVQTAPAGDGSAAAGGRWAVEDGDVEPLAATPVRAGMAFGPTLFRVGDYYGTPVNEAARLTDLARRGTVLVADELRDVLEPTFRLRHIRPVRLHGIGVRRPYALRERV